MHNSKQYKVLFRLFIMQKAYKPCTKKMYKKHFLRILVDFSVSWFL